MHTAAARLMAMAVAFFSEAVPFRARPGSALLDSQDAVSDCGAARGPCGAGGLAGAGRSAACRRPSLPSPRDPIPPAGPARCSPRNRKRFRAGRFRFAESPGGSCGPVRAVRAGRRAPGPRGLRSDRGVGCGRGGGAGRAVRRLLSSPPLPGPFRIRPASRILAPALAPPLACGAAAPSPGPSQGAGPVPDSFITHGWGV